MLLIKKIIVVFFISLFTINNYALSLDQYLQQVIENNPEYISNNIATKSSENKSIDQGDLVTSPKLSGSSSYTYDSEPPTSTALKGSKTETTIYNIGINKLFTSGTNIALEYQNNLNHLDHPNNSLVKHQTFWRVKPILSISQPLWRNWLGTETQAKIQQIKYNNKSNSLIKSFSNKQLLINAEINYWLLATLQETIKIKQVAIKRSQKLLEWQENRKKSGLGTDSDYMQAKSSLAQHRFDLENYFNKANIAHRNFNDFRNKSVNHLFKHETLDNLDNLEKLKTLETLENLEIIEKIDNIKFNKIDQNIIKTNKDKILNRNDIQAKYQNLLAIKASTELNTQEVKPIINLDLKYYPSGRDTTYNHTASEAWRAKHNTYSVGINFDIPIDYYLTKRLNQSYKSDIKAAELNYEKQKFELINEWLSLTEQFNTILHQAKLSEEIVNIQKNKFNNEQDLLKKGRTTTFQVLSFEQDYLNSQLQYLNTINNLLKVKAMLKLYD